MKVSLGVLDTYKKTYSLSVDEDLWRTVHISIFGKKPSFPDAQLEELEDHFNRLEYKGAKAFLLRRLALKSYHSEEIKKALKEREVSCAMIDQLLEEFQTQGYINDSAWVASFVRTLRLQRFGSKAIVQKLRMKGISSDEIEEEGFDERSSIKKLLETRYRSRDLSERKERDKVIGALARKGYKLDDIFAVLRDWSRGKMDDNGQIWTDMD